MSSSKWGETDLEVDSKWDKSWHNKGHLFLCKPYNPKVTEERSEDGETEEEEEEEQQLTETFDQVEMKRRGTETCMLFMKTSKSTLSSSYNNNENLS